METLFAFLNVQLLIFLRIGNLQMLLEIGLLKRKTKTKTKKQKQKQIETKVKKKKKKSKLHQVWDIPVPISTTKDVNMLL